MRIKHLLEGLNAQQRSVPQLPAQARARKISVLGAKTDPKHPFAGYMVGADESAEPGRKRIGPDQNDPYEKGWRAQPDATNPYAAGTPEHAKWQDGRDERAAQPRHYDESVDDDMPDLEEVGEPVSSIMDAERRMAAGDRIFVAHEMDEEPFEIFNVGDLQGYTYDQILVVPQGVAEGRAWHSTPQSAMIGINGNKTMAKSASDSKYLDKSFTYQGHTIKFTPTKREIYKGGDLLHSKDGDYSNPTKRHLSVAHADVGRLMAKREGVAEGRAGVDDTDTVGFSVNTEAAYTAVMKRFGDVIDHDETSGVMYAPARVWPQIEMVAFDADGEGAMRDEGIAEEQLDEKCWDGYEKKGMKTMFGKRVPNCVKNEGEERNELDTPAVQAALAKMAERHKGEKWSKEQLAALGKRIAARGKKPVKDDDVEEGWKSKLAGAALAGATALGGGAASAYDHGDYGHYDQRLDDRSWDTAGYDDHIKSDTKLTKTTTPDGQVKRDSQNRISSVQGPNAQGEYRVFVGQNGKIVSSYITKTPPQNWMVKEDDVADFLARGGKITQVKPNRGPRNPGLSLGSRHIGGGGDGARASRTGRGSKPQGKPVVAVESDVDEGWKSKLAGAALAGAAAFGGGGAQAQTTAPTGVNATGTNAAVVQSLVNPVAQQRFAKMHADTTAKLTDPQYTHNPDALAQHQAAPQQQHAEMLQNIKNIEQWDNPYRIIQMAMNMAGVTPQEVLQNLPKGYKLPTTEPKGTFVPKDLSKLNVREDVTKEDIITKLKAKLGDYLSDLSKEIKQDPDLIDKLAAKSPGDQMGPPVKTVTTDDGHQIQIHGNEDDGFRISIKNKQSASKFKNLDEAVMACEMYCARRRKQTESADYVDEAGKDACYHKVKSRYKIWPSAYASGALVQCRKAGAANWGNKSKK